MIALTDQTLGSGDISLATIESGCQRYDAAATLLDEQIAVLEADLSAVKQKHLRQLKRQAAIVASLEAELRNDIEARPDLFRKPRTVLFHGVKAGFIESKGKLTWDMEDEELVSLLKRKFKEDDAWKSLVIEKLVPSKAELRLLDATTLAKLGCQIEGAGDVVVVKRTAGDVEKMMDKLIEKMVGAMVAED